ncbi:MAG: hypothetical protein RIQ93_2591 [Verrucomicrobiota bacterium]|jgi:hypothetical protein
MYSTHEHLEGDRVRRRTGRTAQLRIDETTRRNIRYYACQSRAALDDRIAELDRERDMEQVLETNASILALAGATLGTTVNRKFFLLTGTVLGFLTQHAVTGWCPPVPLFRRMGVRTRSEIDQEKYALKALRGDFRGLRQAGQPPRVEDALRAVEASTLSHANST